MKQVTQKKFFLDFQIINYEGINKKKDNNFKNPANEKKISRSLAHHQFAIGKKKRYALFLGKKKTWMQKCCQNCNP